MTYFIQVLIIQTLVYIMSEQSVFLTYPILSFMGLMGGYGIIGYLIVTQYLMQKQIRSFLPKTIFTITFMFCLSLLTMYLYQISSIDMSDSLWDFVLSVLVIMCIIVIPACLLFRLPYITYKIKLCGDIRIPLLAILVIIVYLRILTYWSSEIKLKKQIDDDQVYIFTKKHINILVQILVNYGVYIMALMSAYGSVWCPYIYFNHFETARDDLKKAKKKVKDEIYFIIGQIKKNKLQLLLLQERQVQLNKVVEKNKRQSSSIWQKSIDLINPFNKNAQKQELGKVKQKITFHKKQLQTLQRVQCESFLVYRQIVDEDKKHQISETWMGKLFYIFSFFLVVYSITKILLTAWNMINGRKLSTDPITRLLNLISWIRGSDINDAFRTYSQYISFGFMGYLMISSVRSFSMNMKNFFDFILRRKRLNIMATDTLVLLLSEMYGIYFLSAVILLQSGLPRTYVIDFEHITGEVRLVEHFTLFDKLFFWCCAASILFIFFCEYQKKNKMNDIIKERNLINIVD